MTPQPTTNRLKRHAGSPRRAAGSADSENVARQRLMSETRRAASSPTADESIVSAKAGKEARISRLTNLKCGYDDFNTSARLPVELVCRDVTRRTIVIRPYVDPDVYYLLCSR